MTAMFPAIELNEEKPLASKPRMIWAKLPFFIGTHFLVRRLYITNSGQRFMDTPALLTKLDIDNETEYVAWFAKHIFLSRRKAEAKTRANLKAADS